MEEERQFDLQNRATDMVFWLLRQVESDKTNGTKYVFVTSEINFREGGDVFTKPELKIGEMESILRHFDATYALNRENKSLWNISITSFDSKKFGEERGKGIKEAARKEPTETEKSKLKA